MPLPRNTLSLEVFEKALACKKEVEKQGFKILGFTAGDEYNIERVENLSPVLATTTWEQVSALSRVRGTSAIPDPALTDKLAEKADLSGLINIMARYNTTEYQTKFPNVQVHPVTSCRFFTNHYEAFYDFTQTDAGYLRFGLISDPPTEVMEGINTYRLIWYTHGTENSNVRWCAAHTSPEYNYLDAGNLVCFITDGMENKIVVSRTCDVDSILIMSILCCIPSAVKQLEQGFLIPERHRKLLRIKLERELETKFTPNAAQTTTLTGVYSPDSLTAERRIALAEEVRTIRTREYALSAYKEMKSALEADYQKSIEGTLIGKVLRGEVEAGTFNSVKVGKNKATYQTISVEYPDLAKTAIQLLTNNSSPADIYAVVNYMCSFVTRKLDQEMAPDGEHDLVLSDLVINGIPITVSKNANGIRKVNGIRINAAEVLDVLSHAACLHTVTDYENFLEQVSHLSLRWCNVLTDGLGVKIQDLTNKYDERDNRTPGKSAPRLKFIRDGSKFYLVTNSNERVRIRLGECINLIDSLNARANGGYSSGVGYRTHQWAREELKKVLKKCCTFTKTTKDSEGNVTTETKCTITDAQCEELPKILEEMHKAAIKKSEEFLAQAVEVTGSTVIDWNGETAFEVEGSICNYVVVKEDAKVYDKKTGKYICIVDPAQYDGVGYDRVAARLYALKNDAASKEDIHTIRDNERYNHEPATT